MVQGAFARVRPGSDSTRGRGADARVGAPARRRGGDSRPRQPCGEAWAWPLLGPSRKFRQLGCPPVSRGARGFAPQPRGWLALFARSLEARKNTGKSQLGKSQRAGARNAAAAVGRKSLRRRSLSLVSRSLTLLPWRAYLRPSMRTFASRGARRRRRASPAPAWGRTPLVAIAWRWNSRSLPPAASRCARACAAAARSSPCPRPPPARSPGSPSNAPQAWTSPNWRVRWADWRRPNSTRLPSWRGRWPARWSTLELPLRARDPKLA